MSADLKDDFECECGTPKVFRCSCLDKAESDQDREHIGECVELLRKKADTMEEELSKAQKNKE